MLQSIFSQIPIFKKKLKKKYYAVNSNLSSCLVFNKKLLYNIDNNNKLTYIWHFQEWENHDVVIDRRCLIMLSSFKSKARSKSQRDLRRRLSKYRKGRAFKGTRARKSRLFSRSTPMLFLPFVRITSPVCFLTRGPHANACSLVHVNVYIAYVYTCAFASTRFTHMRYTHTRTYTCTHIYDISH